MRISILDYKNQRVIIAAVPQYLIDTHAEEADIAMAIRQALGLDIDDTAYMIGDYDLVLADHNADTSRPGECGIELLTQDFKQDALAALNEGE